MGIAKNPTPKNPDPKTPDPVAVVSAEALAPVPPRADGATWNGVAWVGGSPE